MTLNEYIEVEKKCRHYVKDNEGILNNLTEMKDSFALLQEEYTNKLDSILGNKELYLSERVASEVRNATANDVEEYNRRDKELAYLTTKDYVIDKCEIEQYYSDYLELSKRLKSKINNKQSKYRDIVQMIDRVKITLEKKDVLDKLYNSLEAYEKELASVGEIKDSSGTVNSATKWIFKITAIAVKLQGPAKLIYTVVCYFMFILLIVLFPEIFLIYVSIICIIFLKKNIPVRKKQIEIFRKMKYHKELCDELENLIANRVNSREQDMLKALKLKDFEQLSIVKLALKQLKEKIKRTEEFVKSEAIKNSQSDKYEVDQKRIVDAEYKEKLEIGKEEIEGMRSMYDQSLQEYSELIIQRDAGKEELSERYFKLDKIGKDKILPRKFLLGFNEYVPVTLDMPDYTINLPANMRATDAIKKFIYMCIVQMMCTTNPSCVKVSIVDLINGTSNYGMFGSLEHIVSIIKTQEELDNKIKAMYEIKTDRDTGIKSKFDTIDEYNEYMLSQHGITMHYEILIITHHIDSLYTNKLFRQLQDSGDVGIVTITVWDKNMFMYDAKKSKEYYKHALEYIPYMRNVNYFGDTGELNTLDDQYIRSHVRDITNQLRGRTN